MDLWKEQSVAFSTVDITIVRYDPHKELVWVGDGQGRVASFYGPLLRKYTSFIAHNSPIKDIQLSDKYVVVLGNEGVRTYKRTGTLVASNTQAVGDVLLLLDNNEFLVGYNRRVKRFTLDIQIKENGFFELDSIPEKLHLSHMSLCTPNIAIGLSNGTAQVVEPHTFDPILSKPISCHSGPITDFDSRKNILVTCGLSQRRYGLVPDVFVSSYDTHNRRALAPLSVSSGASYVRLHPKAPNHAIIVGANGQITFMDSKNPSSLFIKQAILQSHIVGFDIGPLGDSFVLAEKNYIHLWSSNQIQHNADSFKGLEVPNSIGTLPNVTDDMPLSSIGMPYYNQELLSNWNPQITFETGCPIPDWEKVDNSLIAPSHLSTKARNTKHKRSSSVSVPRFLSEQARLRLTPSYGSQAFVDLMRSDDSVARGKVPKLWRRMFVHYSKFGVDDFDFSFYNSTEYAGLEPLSASCRCNAILQLYRWCPAIYNYTLHTFAQNNWRDLAIMGELAIVIDMLAQANGYHCRATNFMDTIQMEMTITNFHSYLMNQLSDEYKQIDAIKPCPLSNQIKTIHVNSDQTVPSQSWGIHDFESLCPFLFVSINEDTYSHVTTGPRIHSRFWLDTVGYETCVTVNRRTSDEYQLCGYITEVTNDGDQHAIAVIKIEDQWHLFNDFLVTPISDAEALDFSPSWKRPCLLMYGYNGGAKGIKVDFNTTWRDKLDYRILREQRLSSGNMSDPGTPGSLLKSDETIPELVALDAEFVLIRKELSEVHSDGSKNLVSPKKLSLARLSVLRSDESVLFDDMVESQQPVVDYVTAYSGIEPGDLDPVTSKYGLVARSTSTRKLWLLLNSGTKFVGHALVNDFRTINLYVPPKQVIDTCDLFYDRDRNGMRRLSLKFLMWAVLDQQVQTGNHDSVQDAQSALRLYKHYVELLNMDLLDEVLTIIATKGQRNNYRVPSRSQNGGNNGGNCGSPSIPSTPIRF